MNAHCVELTHINSLNNLLPFGSMTYVQNRRDFKTFSVLFQVELKHEYLCSSIIILDHELPEGVLRLDELLSTVVTHGRNPRVDPVISFKPKGRSFTP